MDSEKIVSPINQSIRTFLPGYLVEDQPPSVALNRAFEESVGGRRERPARTPEITCSEQAAASLSSEVFLREA